MACAQAPTSWHLRAFGRREVRPILAHRYAEAGSPRTLLRAFDAPYRPAFRYDPVGRDDDLDLLPGPQLTHVARSGGKSLPARRKADDNG